MKGDNKTMYKIEILNEKIDDAMTIVKILLRNNYNVVMKDDGTTTIIQYDFSDPDFGGDVVVWLKENEIVTTGEEMDDACNRAYDLAYHRGYNDGYKTAVERKEHANDVTCYDLDAEMTARANSSDESEDY